MSWLLKISFQGVRSLAVLWMAVSFVGFSTAVYNPNFHEVLHPHEAHERHEIEHDHADDHHHEHGEEDRRPSDADTSCQTCNVLSHVATNVSPTFQVSYNSSALAGFLQRGEANVYLSQFYHSLYGRAPPAVF